MKDADIEEGTLSTAQDLPPLLLPEAQKPSVGTSLIVGVSTRNGPSPTGGASGLPFPTPRNLPQWYVLRSTYGQEKKAYEFITSHGGTAFYPTVKEVRLVNGKRRRVSVSRIPNTLFAYGTFEEIKSFVYDNINLPFLRFYYRYFRKDGKMMKEPLVVPDRQMQSMKIICAADGEDIIIYTSEIPKFQTGQLVRIVEGQFKGIVGRVTRYRGQQRVGVVIDGLLTAVTAYVPSAFLRESES